MLPLLKAGGFHLTVRRDGSFETSSTETSSGAESAGRTQTMSKCKDKQKYHY